MAHNDSDDKVDLAGEGLSADSQEPAAIEAANENASLRDRLLRALAEVENTRRRAERSVADAREYGISDFAAELLSVVDSLQRAVASAEDRTDQTPADAAFLDGVRATQRQLLATLARYPHGPGRERGSVFAGPIADDGNFSLWLEHLTERGKPADAFWFQWYDNTGEPSMPTR